MLRVFLAQCLKIAAFIEIGFGRLYERQITMKQVILTLIIQLIHCRENCNSDFASPRKNVYFVAELKMSENVF